MSPHTKKQLSQSVRTHQGATITVCQNTARNNYHSLSENTKEELLQSVRTHQGATITVCQKTPRSNYHSLSENTKKMYRQLIDADINLDKTITQSLFTPTKTFIFGAEFI
jgi:hypothetical protein